MLRRTPRLAPALAWAPLGVGAVYAVVFLAMAPAIARSLYLNADVASGPVIAHLLPAAPGRSVLLGNYAWWEALWAQRGLDALPGHRALLEGVPYLLGLATAGLVAWSVAVVSASRRAAGVAAVMVLAAGPTVWASFGAWTVHGLTWLHVAALGSFVVWLVRRPRGTLGIAAGLALGAVTGVAVASDPLVAVAGLAPMVLAALMAPRSAWLGAVAACLGGTAASAVVFELAMHATGIRAAGTLPIRAASPGSLGHNARIVLRALADVVDGHFIGDPLGVSTLAHAGAAILAVAGAAACAVVVVQVLRRRSAGVGVRVHVVFWATAAVALLAAVTLTTVPVDATSSRYLIGVLLAMAALLPLAGRDALVGAGVTAYACVGLLALARGEMTANGARVPGRGQAAALARLAAGQHVRVGYAGYWDAAPLTWSTGFAVRVFPVRMCDAEGRPCAFEFHRIASWYRPRRGVRSMLIVDRTIRALSVTAIDPKLGPPALTRRVGQLQVAIYDYDIAGRFGPPARGAQGGT